MMGPSAMTERDSAADIDRIKTSHMCVCFVIIGIVAVVDARGE